MSGQSLPGMGARHPRTLLNLALRRKEEERCPPAISPKKSTARLPKIVWIVHQKKG